MMMMMMMMMMIKMMMRMMIKKKTRHADNAQDVVNMYKDTFCPLLFTISALQHKS